ncbi:MAG TPA: EpsI family protein [Gemmatimonadales bacterium]
MIALTRWIPAILLGAGCLLTLGVNRQRDMPLAEALDSIPMTLGGRTGRDLEIAEEERVAAGMTSYIFRVSEEGPSPLSVYVGYYDHQTQGKTIHSPKNCLPGSGWEALEAAPITLTTASGVVTVNRYLLQNKDQQALVFYWYQGRGRVAASEYQVKWELLRDAALRGRSEEALVRVVVFLNDKVTENQAVDQASRVAADLVPAVFRSLPA